MLFGLLGRGGEQQYAGRILRTDLHSHLVPRVDDGVQSIEESLHTLEMLARLGFKKIITTPHLGHPLWPDNRSAIIQGGALVADAVAEAGLEIDFRVAAEYYFGEELKTSISQDTLLTLDGHRVLMETHMDFPPPDLHETIFAMRCKGYRPVIAHPERYLYLHRNVQLAEQLREWGCEFQITIGSLSGRYGKKIAATAMHLANRGWADFLATDLHRREQLEDLQTSLGHRSVTRILKTALKNTEL